MALITELYPPIMQDILPSVIKTNTTYKIYFSISNYNNINEIKNVQISLVNQKTNVSILKKHYGRQGLL